MVSKYVLGGVIKYKLTSTAKLTVFTPILAQGIGQESKICQCTMVKRVDKPNQTS